MASAAQIDANRLNSQKSTGPRSDEGKAASKFNALKHGIEAAASTVLPFEDPELRSKLDDSYIYHCEPVGPEELFLVQAMSDAHWLRLRYQAIENQIMNQMLADMDPTDYPLAKLFDPGNPLGKPLERIIRHREAAERAWHRAYQAFFKSFQIRKACEAREKQRAAVKPPERTQFKPPFPAVPTPKAPENLALRL